jgi:hypothetical protein
VKTISEMERTQRNISGLAPLLRGFLGRTRGRTFPHLNCVYESSEDYPHKDFGEGLGKYTTEAVLELHGQVTSNQRKHSTKRNARVMMECYILVLAMRISEWYGLEISIRDRSHRGAGGPIIVSKPTARGAK